MTSTTGTALQSPFLRLYREHQELHEVVDTLLQWIAGRKMLEGDIETAAFVVGQQMVADTRRSEAAFSNFYETLSRVLVPDRDPVYELVFKAKCDRIQKPHRTPPTIWGVANMRDVASLVNHLDILESPDYFLGDHYTPECVRCEERGDDPKRHTTDISFRRYMSPQIGQAVHSYEDVKREALRAETRLYLARRQTPNNSRKLDDLEYQLVEWQTLRDEQKAALRLTHDDAISAMSYTPGQPSIIESDARIKSIGSMRLKFVDYLLFYSMQQRGELGDFAKHGGAQGGIDQIDDVYAGKLIVPFHLENESFPLARDIISIMRGLGAEVLPVAPGADEVIEWKDKPTYRGVKLVVNHRGLHMEYQLQTPHDRELDRGTHKEWKQERRAFIHRAKEFGYPVRSLYEVAAHLFPATHS